MFVGKYDILLKLASSSTNDPIESGSDSKRFVERLSSSRFYNPTIESGIGSMDMGFEMSITV